MTASPLVSVPVGPVCETRASQKTDQRAPRRRKGAFRKPPKCPIRRRLVRRRNVGREFDHAEQMEAAAQRLLGLHAASRWPPPRPARPSQRCRAWPTPPRSALPYRRIHRRFTVSFLQGAIRSSSKDEACALVGAQELVRHLGLRHFVERLTGAVQ